MSEEKKIKVNITVLILTAVSAILGGMFANQCSSNKQYKAELATANFIFETETTKLAELINIKDDTIQYLKEVINTNDEQIVSQKIRINGLITQSQDEPVMSTGECIDYITQDIPAIDSAINIISDNQACALADSLYELYYLNIIVEEQKRYEDMLLTGINERDDLVLQVSERADAIQEQLKLSEALRATLNQQNKKLSRKLKIRTWTLGGVSVGLVILAVAT